MDDFSKGIVDTRRLVYYLTASGFFLFLTGARARRQEVEMSDGAPRRASRSCSPRPWAPACCWWRRSCCSSTTSAGSIYQRFDWTGSKLYSLSEKSLNVLEGPRPDVEAVIFMRPSDRSSSLRPRSCSSATAPPSSRVKVRVVDPDKQPRRGPGGWSSATTSRTPTWWCSTTARTAAWSRNRGSRRVRLLRHADGRRARA